MKISYESGDLIEEVKQDIQEFGEDEKIYTMYEMIENHEFITNYDFIVEEKPLTKEEIQSYSRIEILTLKQLLKKLEEQDQIL